MSDNISDTEGISDQMAESRLSNNDAGDHDNKLYQNPIPKSGIPVVFPQPPDDWQFNQFINEIADDIEKADIDHHDLEKMKFQCSGAGGIQFHVLEEIKTVRSLFRVLKNREFLNRENMVYLQILLKVSGRMDLVEKVIDYAMSMGNTLYFYPATREPENGYKYVKMHVEGIDFSNSTMMYIQDLKLRLSMALCVPIQFIYIAGIEPSSSLLITFMIPEEYVELMVKRLTNGDRFPKLHSHHIDVIQIGDKAFNITGQVEAQVGVSEQHEKLTSVYQQLNIALHNLGRSELEVVRISEEIERIQNEDKHIRDDMANMRKQIEDLTEQSRAITMAADQTEELICLDAEHDSIQPSKITNMDEPNIRKIPGQDYESDYYVMRKPALVIFLAQDLPKGTSKNAKLKARVTCKESALVDRIVDIDMKLLDEFFREQCQTTPTILRLVNYTHDEIRDAFAKIDGARYDAFFFIFLSFLSTKERVKKRKLPCIKVDCYDSAVPIGEYISMVKGRADLALKPKVFLFQADDQELLDPMRITKIDPDDVFWLVKIPSDADQLVILSTLPQLLPTLKKASSKAVPTASVAGGVVSQPSDAGDEKVAVKQENSLFIRAFVEVLKANKDTDVLCCIPLINGKIEEMKASLDLEAYRAEKAETLQVPLVMSTLTKKIKFYEARDF